MQQCHHKLLLWLILAAITANISQLYLGEASVFWLIYLGAALFPIVTIIYLGKALKFPVAELLLLILGLFVPVLGLLLLLFLHGRAMEALKSLAPSLCSMHSRDWSQYAEAHQM